MAKKKTIPTPHTLNELTKLATEHSNNTLRTVGFPVGDLDEAGFAAIMTTIGQQLALAFAAGYTAAMKGINA